MTILPWTIVLVLAVGAGPADPHQAAQTADIEMTKCFYGQAAALDDHVSDAATIARAVVSACHPQFDDWKYANYLELKPFDSTRFYAGLERAASNYALEAVLRVRAASKH